MILIFFFLFVLRYCAHRSTGSIWLKPNTRTIETFEHGLRGKTNWNFYGWRKRTEKERHRNKIILCAKQNDGKQQPNNCVFDRSINNMIWNRSSCKGLINFQAICLFKTHRRRRRRKTPSSNQNFLRSFAWWNHLNSLHWISNDAGFLFSQIKVFEIIPSHDNYAHCHCRTIWMAHGEWRRVGNGIRIM